MLNRGSELSLCYCQKASCPLSNQGWCGLQESTHRPTVCLKSWVRGRGTRLHEPGARAQGQCCGCAIMGMRRAGGGRWTQEAQAEGTRPGTPPPLLPSPLPHQGMQTAGSTAEGPGRELPIKPRGSHGQEDIPIEFSCHTAAAFLPPWSWADSAHETSRSSPCLRLPGPSALCHGSGSQQGRSLEQACCPACGGMGPWNQRPYCPPHPASENLQKAGC